MSIRLGKFYPEMDGIDNGYSLLSHVNHGMLTDNLVNFRRPYCASSGPEFPKSRLTQFQPLSSELNLLPSYIQPETYHHLSLS